MSLLSALLEERDRRVRVRRRLAELSARGEARDCWWMHWEYDDHDPATCEYCLPGRMAHRDDAG